MPHQTAAVSAQVLCTPYNHAPCHFMQSHTRKVCLAVTCHLHFWQNDRDLPHAAAVTRGWNGYRNESISTESRPRRRKFSRRSCRDSNPRPSNHESGALTTELSPIPLLFALTPLFKNCWLLSSCCAHYLAENRFLIWGWGVGSCLGNVKDVTTRYICMRVQEHLTMKAD